MIKIIPMDDPRMQPENQQEYAVYLNGKQLFTFQHYRQKDGLSQCLFDAAKACQQYEEERYQAYVAMRTRVFQQHKL